MSQVVTLIESSGNDLRIQGNRLFQGSLGTLSSTAMILIGFTQNHRRQVMLLTMLGDTLPRSVSRSGPLDAVHQITKSLPYFFFFHLQMS